MKVSTRIDERKSMEMYVDNCKLESPEEVMRLFKEYTYLIWNDFFVGKIYDFYDEDAVMNHAGGHFIQGIPKVFADTLGSLAIRLRERPGEMMMFVEIFCEGNAEDGYRFIQMVTYYDADKGPYPAQEGKVLPDVQIGRANLCECDVRKINGRWMIVEEWLVRAPDNAPTA